MIDALWLALRLAVGAVLLLAALPKIGDITRFAEDLGRYRLLPRQADQPVVWAVVLAELLAAGLLLAGASAGFWLAAILFSGFVVAIGSALVRRLVIPCGCFGGDDVVSVTALVRVALLLGACVAGIALGSTGPARLVSGWDLPMAVTLAVGGLMLGRLLLLLPDVRSAMGFASSAPVGGTAPPEGAG